MLPGLRINISPSCRFFLYMGRRFNPTKSDKTDDFFREFLRSFRIIIHAYNRHIGNSYVCTRVCKWQTKAKMLDDFYWFTTCGFGAYWTWIRWSCITHHHDHPVLRVDIQGLWSFLKIANEIEILFDGSLTCFYPATLVTSLKEKLWVHVREHRCCKRYISL